MMLPAGALRFGIAWSHAAPPESQKDVIISGYIVEEPYYKQETKRTICVLDDISINGEDMHGRMRLYLRGDTDLLQNVELGQFVSCKASIWHGNSATNHAQFDFSNYLRANRLRGYATADITNASFTAPEIDLRTFNDKLCNLISLRIDRLFPENSVIVKAFVLGDRNEMDQEDRESYNRAGVAHLLAISGMHISVLAMFLYWMIARFLSRRSSFAVTMIALLGYGWLIGFSPSLIRAILMYGIYGLAAVAGRYSDSVSRISCAALIHLFIFPMDILSASFVLSYCASAGILLLAQPVGMLLHLDKLLTSKSKNTFFALFARRLPKWVAQSIVTSLSAQIAAFPAVIHYFGAQSVWSLFTNLLAVPLAMVAYILSLAGVVTGISPLCISADGLFGLLTGFVRAVATLPLTRTSVARFPPWLLIACAVLFILSSGLSKFSEKLRRFLPLCIIPALMISGGLSFMSRQGNSLMFMDAGQADCALLRTDGRIYLFDTGDAYTPAADYLCAMNYPLDGVFISHPHTDHAGGLAEILKVTQPRCIYISSNYDQYEVDEDILSAIRNAELSGSEIRMLKTGDRIELSEKSFVKVHSPNAGIQQISANEDSLILELQCNGVSAIFCGDMPVSAMPENLPDVDILKVAHHGSSSSVDPRILTQLSPSVAVIPVGDNNYGHPTAETIELLEASGAKVYRTDLCGAISCDLRNDGSIGITTYNQNGGKP